jgi:hypothetical protein
MPGGRLQEKYREETGIAVECTSMAIVNENFWKENGVTVREYGFYFWVVPRPALPEPMLVRSQEGHIEFGWFDLDRLDGLTIVPAFLKDILPTLGRETRFIRTGR